ncbi:hypothetical protein MTO96_034546, partial [Rhipicephalus appendiculatus]
FRNQEYSFWNCFDIKGELTLAELLEYFRLRHEVEVTSVSKGAQILYDAKAPPSRALMKHAVSKVLERVSKAEIDSGTLALTLHVTGKDAYSGEEVEVPTVRYLLRR